MHGRARSLNRLGFSQKVAKVPPLPALAVPT